MKKLSMLFLAVILMASAMVSAQSPKSILKFATSIEGSSDPNIANQGKSTYEIAMLGNKTKLVQSGQGVTISIITDGDNKSQTILFETPMGNYFLTMPESEINEEMKNVSFSYDYTGETKTIAGHACQKVIAKMVNNETDDESEVVLYVTEELPSTLNFSQFPDLKGYPLRQEVASPELGDGVIVVVECTEVAPAKKLKPVAFVLPEATDVRTDPEMYESFKKMIKGEAEEE